MKNIKRKINIVHFVSNHGLGPLSRSISFREEFLSIFQKEENIDVYYLLIVGPESTNILRNTDYLYKVLLPAHTSANNRQNWSIKTYTQCFSDYHKNLNRCITEFFQCTSLYFNFIISDQIPESIKNSPNNSIKIFITDQLKELDYLDPEFDYLPMLENVNIIIFADTNCAYQVGMDLEVKEKFKDRVLVTTPIIDYKYLSSITKIEARQHLGIDMHKKVYLLNGLNPHFTSFITNNLSPKDSLIVCPTPVGKDKLPFNKFPHVNLMQTNSKEYLAYVLASDVVMALGGR